MLTLELYPYISEILNDNNMLLGQTVIGCSLLSQKYSKLIGRYWVIMRRQLYALNCPVITEHGLNLIIPLHTANGLNDLGNEMKQLNLSPGNSKSLWL